MIIKNTQYYTKEFIKAVEPFSEKWMAKQLDIHPQVFNKRKNHGDFTKPDKILLWAAITNTERNSISYETLWKEPMEEL
jgi:hypothetical protein